MTRPRLPVLLAVAALAPTAVADLNAVEQDVLTPTTPAWFGDAVALDGDLAVVGNRDETEAGLVGAGAVYVYEFDGSTWNEVERVVSSAPVAGSGFGSALALSGGILAVGQPDSSTAGGSVHVYQRVGSSFVFRQMLQGAQVSGGFDEYGHSVDVTGTRLAVGAIRDGSSGVSSGAAYVYRLDGGTWVAEATLTAPQPASSDWMGQDVDFDGDARLIVGAPSHGGAGSAFVYDRSGTTWTETAWIDGGVSFIGFGGAVALDGNVAAIGASSDDTVMGTNSGAVYVYRSLGGSWSQEQQIIPPGPTSIFGYELELEDGLLYVSEIDQDRTVHAFGEQGTSWPLVDTFTSPNVGNSTLGWSLAISGNRLLVGSPSFVGQDAAFIFELQADEPVNYCTAGTSFSGCLPTISSTGQASANATSGFDLVVSGVEGSKRGLFYWSSNGRQAAPWGNSTSFQCVMPPVFRGDLLQENGTTGLCDGFYAYDLNTRWTNKPWQNPGVGAVVQAQFWYRDPFAPTNVSTSISGAIEFTVAP